MCGSKTLWFILTLGAVWCCSCADVFALPFRSDINQGNNLYYKGQYDAAANKYIKSIKKNNNPIALFNLGDTLYRQGKYSESSLAFAQLTQEAGNIRIKQKAFYNMGNASFRQEDYQQAVDLYEDALKIDPKDEDARYNLELAKKLLKMPKEKRPKQNQRQKQKQNQRRDQTKQQSPAKHGLSKEDAERILQGISGDEKHKAKEVRGGRGEDWRDW
jgi:Ca-activated chloride channel family protein